MADFDELLKGVKQRKMKMILDLVVNHSSDEHACLLRVVNQKTIRIVITTFGVPAKRAKSRITGSRTFPSAWKKDAATGEYYLHLFAEKQPDLNWENPKCATKSTTS